jgi:hypothetical protein
VRRGDSVQNAAMSTQEDAPEDEQGEDTGAEEDSGATDEQEPQADESQADESKSDGPKKEDDPLERITERIDKARAQAEDAGVIDDTEEEYFAESGATEVEDDQTIAPPG